MLDSLVKGSSHVDARDFQWDLCLENTLVMESNIEDDSDPENLEKLAYKAWYVRSLSWHDVQIHDTHDSLCVSGLIMFHKAHKGNPTQRAIVNCNFRF